METYTIDATGKKFGRVASEAAKVLMGKHRVDYTPNKPGSTKVVIENAKELSISEKKQSDIVYKRYSGYPGGQRVETLKHLTDRRGIGVALRKSIEKMLPRNTLRKMRIKRLEIK